MAVNSSSPTFSYHCSDSPVADLISVCFIALYLFLHVPLSILILYLGYRRWRQRRSLATTSHSDVFTYHSAAKELIYAIGNIFYFCGKYAELTGLLKFGFYATCNIIPGQLIFHVLTCVERYLAVVHPVIYLRLRQSRGSSIRNTSIGCAWLLYCGWIGFEALYNPADPYIPIYILLVLCLAVVSFCSISVLRVLIRPGPGGLGVGKEQAAQSKQRAFSTITAITGVLWTLFLGLLVSNGVHTSNLLSPSDSCLAMMLGDWFALPSSLVLPLLFLHRAGKLNCCHGSK